MQETRLLTERTLCKAPEGPYEFALVVFDGFTKRLTKLIFPEVNANHTLSK